MTQEAVKDTGVTSREAVTHSYGSWPGSRPFTDW